MMFYMDGCVLELVFFAFWQLQNITKFTI